MSCSAFRENNISRANMMIKDKKKWDPSNSSPISFVILN